jgi:thymidine kinase
VRDVIFADWVERRGLSVYLFGLSSDFLADPWPSVSAAQPLADCVTVLKARCDACGAPATLTAAIAAMPTDGRVNPGGSEKYEARCRQCYLRSNG